MAIAHLLIYVQLVLLFQEKNRRVYGQLAMFSLLQVVVASLLNSSLEFGMLLASYMVIALIGFVLFFVFREVSRVGMVTRRRSWFGTKVRNSETLDALSDGLPVLEVVDTGAALNRKIVTRKIVFPIVAMVSATIVFTAVFFYTTPRTGGANWQSGGGGRTLVGFSPEVSFDEMGELLLNDARVMRVSFTNVRNGEPYTVIGEPYFRGGALTHYLTFRGAGIGSRKSNRASRQDSRWPAPPAHGIWFARTFCSNQPAAICSSACLLPMPLLRLPKRFELARGLDGYFDQVPRRER